MIVHADLRGRDSLPLDLMEAVRPNVDRYLLAVLRDRVFRASEFHETRRGSCRILSPLTHELATTLPAWRQALAPVVEHVAALLVGSEPTPGRPPTPLTLANQRTALARRHGRKPAPALIPVPQPERRCQTCGGKLPDRDRSYCDDCLPAYERAHQQAFTAAGHTAKARMLQAGIDPFHGGQAAQRRSASMTRRWKDIHDWSATHADAEVDRRVFEREILPLIQEVPLSELVRATGLSDGYLSQIRHGKKTPHPRHWEAFRVAVEGSSA